MTTGAATPAIAAAAASGSAAPAVVPNAQVRPAVAMDFTGRWELDREKSESLYTHVKSLGLDEVAALASEKLNVILDIVQTKTTITIWQNSQLGETKRVLKLEGETIEGKGDKKATVKLGIDAILVETRFPKGCLLDRREIEPSGETMAQILELHVTSGASEGQVVRTRRYFRKLGPPDATVTAEREHM